MNDPILQLAQLNGLIAMMEPDQQAKIQERVKAIRDSLASFAPDQFTDGMAIGLIGLNIQIHGHA